MRPSATVMFCGKLLTHTIISPSSSVVLIVDGGMVKAVYPPGISVDFSKGVDVVKTLGEQSQ